MNAIVKIAIYSILSLAGAINAAPERLTADQARHFLIRTGFAPTQGQVDAVTGQSAQAVVTQALAAAKASKTIHPAPDFVAQPPPIPYALLKTKEEQQAMRQQQMREGLELKTWWMREMIESPTPLQERMALFWHNHFATSQQKVIRSQAMWNQHQLLRANALGSFATLLHAVAKDPAMLVYLDGANSRREAPNENFAREVMELFSLGEATGGGGYSEQDIREAARAFTGWSIDRDSFSFRFRPAFHDSAVKTVLGRTGNFDGDAVLDVMLAQDAAARFIVGKLWKEFVSPVPDAKEVARIGQAFRASGYDIGTALREMLLSDAFWAADNPGSLVKSPVDLVVGTVRQFGFTYTDAMPFALKSAQLGQNLLVPPNVKGWPGYTDWINATTLLERKRFTEQLFRAVEFQGESKSPPPGAVMGMGAAGRPMAMMREEFAAEKGDKGGQGSNRQALALLGRDGIMRVAQGMAKITFDPDRWLAAYGGRADSEPNEALKTRLAQVVLASPATQNIAPGTVGVAYLRSLTLDPAYQLK
jgi:uncharacterized protein (DUF1800 family)